MRKIRYSCTSKNQYDEDKKGVQSIENKAMTNASLYSYTSTKH